MIANRFGRICRLIFWRTRARGCHYLSRKGPAILVCNHLGTYGPLSVMSSLPVTLHPWVAHEVTELDKAAERIRRDFVERELHLGPPVSRWVSGLIARICVALMRKLDVVPVYDQSRRIRITVERSVQLLEQGRSLLVFPEDPDVPGDEVMGELRTGFLHVARLFYARTKRAVAILPVAVNRSARGIRVGAPIPFDGAAPFRAEKLRLKRELTGTIYRLYRDIERDTATRYLSRAAGA
jgi:1-acyl-sn-glycerol-3-phosphate acyltransferase